MTEPPPAPGTGPWRLAALPPLPVEVLAGFVDGLPIEVVVPATRDRAGLHESLAAADLVLGDWTGQLTLGADEAAAAPRLAFVQQPSVGVESVDLDAFARHRVPVANTAGANATSVAEWCLAATLALVRSLSWADAGVRAGGWPQLELMQRGSREMSAVRVGIVGFGDIGRECARLFGSLGCPVSYWTRRRRAPAEEHGAVFRDLDELLSVSDVLVVVIALAAQTRGLLDARRLSLLPAGAYVVNAARGHIIDESALLAALDGGALAGAALDVFDTEPLPVDSALRRHELVLLSPHASGATTQSAARVIDTAVANLRRAVTGEPVLHVQNGVDPAIRRRD